ncbi:uncharacterized protein LOC141591015 [Silene latifolia]|uniref:uncharacterized protein LOC141591015 n=1 Tax=Silene latifolia TaxID=37657 RepID=UPI003D7805B6
MLAKIEKLGGDKEDIPRELEAFIDKSFLFKVYVHEKFNVSQGSTSYIVSSLSNDADLANKWLSKYTEMFKEEFHCFKSRTKPLLIKESSKALIDIINAEEEEKSQTDSSRITPLKRSHPTDDYQSADGDASSTTKNNVIVKKEK